MAGTAQCRHSDPLVGLAYSIDSTFGERLIYEPFLCIALCWRKYKKKSVLPHSALLLSLLFYVVVERVTGLWGAVFILPSRL